MPGARPVTRLGHQGERRVFSEGCKFFKQCPVFLNYVQHIIPGGQKLYRGTLPPAARSYGPAWSTVRLLRSRVGQGIVMAYEYSSFPKNTLPNYSPITAAVSASCSPSLSAVQCYHWKILVEVKQLTHTRSSVTEAVLLRRLTLSWTSTHLSKASKETINNDE